MWPSRFAEEQKLEGSGATPSVARRIHAPLETERRTYSHTAGLGLSLNRLNAKQPRVANMLSRSSAASRCQGRHTSSHRTITADSVMTTRDDSVFTICATASRHFSSGSETDPKTVQTLLRHSDVKLTLQFYTHAVSRDRMVAAGKMLTAISVMRQTKTDYSGLSRNTDQDMFFKAGIYTLVFFTRFRRGLKADWKGFPPHEKGRPPEKKKSHAKFF